MAKVVQSFHVHPITMAMLVNQNQMMEDFLINLVVDIAMVSIQFLSLIIINESYEMKV